MSLYGPLFAVHIADGVMQPAWLIGGFALAILVLLLSAYRLADDEVTRCGFLAAAGFVASQIHVPLGITSVHLLLNGVIGVILRRRSPLALATALALQSLLFSHGGMTAWGLNVLILSLPALAAGALFPIFLRALCRAPRLLAGSITFLTVLIGFAAMLTSIQIAVLKLAGENPRSLIDSWLLWWLSDGLVISAVAAGAGGLTLFLLSRRNGRVLTAGVLLGFVSGFLTVLLNAATLALGSLKEVQIAVPVILLANLPVVLIESVVLGFLTAYLSQVKPEWLGLRQTP